LIRILGLGIRDLALGEAHQKSASITTPCVIQLLILNSPIKQI